MNHKLRLGCVSVATVALAAAASLAASPAHAEGHGSTFTKHTTKRAVAKTGASDRTASSTVAAPVARIAGSDRIQTAIQASLAAWDNAGTADGALAKAVVLSRYDEYADALGGSALAGAAVGPLLMTPPTSLNAAVKAEIDRVLGGKGTIYVLGGLGAVSADVEKSLQAAGYTVVRLAGADRYDTSVKVAEEVGKLAPGGKPQFVFATTGLNFPDGLAAGATAGGHWASVVLTRDNTLTGSVQTYLDAMTAAGVDEYAVGGAATSVARTWDYTYNGADRYETAELVAGDFWSSPEPADDPSAIGLATGMNWPDALAGGAFMAGWGPLVLSRTDSLPTPTSTVIQAIVASGDPSPVQGGFIFGGDTVVGPTAEAQFATLLG
jgi:putative cell wall-binding protein